MSTSIPLTLPTRAGDVTLSVDERGSGRPVVLPHGGAGPASFAGFADLLTAEAGVRALVPTHPGFGGTTRPEAFDDVAALADLYIGLLDALRLDDAVVIGNSLGGWVAAEIATRRPARLGALVLVDAVGIDVPGHPVATGLSPAELARHAWHDPSKSPAVDPATLPPAVRAVLAGNAAALAVYGGTMADPTLIGRLADVAVPTLVVWGEADRIVDVDYGRAYADAIPGARLALLRETGHLPQLETPRLLLDAVTVAGDRDAAGPARRLAV